MTDPAPELVVAVLTYQRPHHVARIVPDLLRQLDTVRATCGTTTLLVVDNSPDGASRDQVAAFADPRVRYVHEPSPGIVAGRNRALDEAATATVLVFVDDDERPSDQWLRSLLATYLEHRPGGVVGPIRCVFDTEPEPWVRDGGFFDRRRMPTGSTVDVAATNNLLLDLATVRGLGLRFDERYSRIGGSDHLFTRRLVRSGAVLLWNNEAVVDDLVPAERTTRQWVRRRQYRIGTSASLVDVDLARRGLPRAKARLSFAGQGLTRVGGGALRWAAGVVTGSVGRRGAGVRNMWRGAGLVAGAFGRGYAEYRRTPVSAGASSAPRTPEVAA